MSQISRTKAAVVNSSVASIAQVTQLIFQFISRTFFIHLLGVELLGLNGLYTNLLGYLNFAELGIGAAITFSLYEPIVNNDQSQISAIMQMYKRWYRYIAGIVGVGGVILSLFVPNFIKGGGANLIVNVRVAFLLALANTVCSYLVTYKRTLLIADQKGYLNTLNSVGFNILGQIIQIIIMCVWKNYYIYLIIQATIMLVSNLKISRLVDRIYPFLKDNYNDTVDQKVVRYMKKNISGMLSAKMGGIIVTGTDNLLLSFFVGLKSVAMYSNYTMVTAGLTQIMVQMVSAVESSIGNLGATKDNPKKKEKVFYQYFTISSLLSFLVAIGFASFSSAFVGLWVGKSMVYTIIPLMCISVNFFLQNLRQSVINYTNAYGLYWYARWKPVFESLVNFAISWSLVKYTTLNISGVLLGTIASNLIVNLVWEPFIVMRFGLRAPFLRMMKLYLAYTIVGSAYILVTTWIVESFQLVSVGESIVSTVIFEIIGILLFIIVTALFYPKRVGFIDARKLLSRLLVK